jgi:hypothetical protein
MDSATRAGLGLCYAELETQCGLKGLSRNSDGFRAFLRYASGKHTCSADNSPPNAEAPVLGLGLERGPVGHSPHRSHAPHASILGPAEAAG